jgi:hypothetical protein
VLGYLDDLIIVPLGIVLAVNPIPSGLMAEFRAEAIRSKPTSRAGAMATVIVWALISIALISLLWPYRSFVSEVIFKSVGHHQTLKTALPSAAMIAA